MSRKGENQAYSRISRFTVYLSVSTVGKMEAKTIDCDFTADVCRWRINATGFAWDVADVDDTTTGLYSNLCNRRM